MRFFRGSGERNKARRRIIGDVVIKYLSLISWEGDGVGEGCFHREDIGLYIEIL
jgi:hypothetical protein